MDSGCSLWPTARIFFLLVRCFNAMAFSLETLHRVLFSSQALNHKRALSSLCALFSLIVIHSSCLRIFVGEGLMIVNNHRGFILWILIQIPLRDLQVIVI